MLLGPLLPYERDTIVYALLTQRNRLHDDLEEERRTTPESIQEAERIMRNCDDVLDKVMTKRQRRENPRTT